MNSNIDSKSNDRFIIFKIGVNAPLTYKRIPRSGQMPMPDSPDDIAYYDFSEFPVSLFPSPIYKRLLIFVYPRGIYTLSLILTKITAEKLKLRI